eukprot:9497476-Pyramimonas_sp.AAC.1
MSHYFSGPVLEFTQRAPGRFRNTYLGRSWSIFGPLFNFAFLFWAGFGIYSGSPRSMSEPFSGPSWSILGLLLGRPANSHYLPGLVLEFIQRAFGQFRNTFLGLSWSILGPVLGLLVNFALLFWARLARLGVYPESPSVNFARLPWALLEYSVALLGPPGQFRIHLLGQQNFLFFWGGPLGVFLGPSWAPRSISHDFSEPVLKFTQRGPRSISQHFRGSPWG